MQDNDSKYIVEQLDEIDAVECPCGLSRRAFIGDADSVATMHRVDICEDARTHYHKKLTELYLILEGPLCRHRAVGKMRVVVVAIPAFDPEDEWFD
jgi:hypothetical protein